MCAELRGSRFDGALYDGTLDRKYLEMFDGDLVYVYRRDHEDAAQFIRTFPTMITLPEKPGRAR
jgi:hypothetical protein